MATLARHTCDAPKWVHCMPWLGPCSAWCALLMNSSCTSPSSEPSGAWALPEPGLLGIDGFVRAPFRCAGAKKDNTNI